MKNVTIPQLWLVAGAITTVIMACTPKPEPKTVDFYVENKEARLERLAECQNNAGTLKDDPDCLNAKQAAVKVWSKPSLPSFDPNSPSGQAAPSGSMPASEPAK